MENVELVMMNYDESVEDALAWAKKEAFPWPSVLGADKEKVHFSKFKVDGVPTYILVGKDGKEISRAHEKDEIFKKIESL